jgi:hypothetical protein
LYSRLFLWPWEIGTGRWLSPASRSSSN